MTYQYTAAEAAKYEKKGNFKLAALLWGKASELAKKDINRHFALAREAFCIKQNITQKMENPQ